jgi:hypothetical protein
MANDMAWVLPVFHSSVAKSWSACLVQVHQDFLRGDIADEIVLKWQRRCEVTSISRGSLSVIQFFPQSNN